MSDAKTSDGRRARGLAILLALIGLGGAAALLATHDASGILAALEAAGWGVLVVIALHLPQTFLSGVAFRPLIDRDRNIWLMWLLRWIRESVNTLLPVAQVGGDVVRVRLLARRDLPLRGGISASLVDVTMEMAAQLVFTLLGVAALLAGAHVHEALPVAGAAVAVTAIVVTIFVVAQRVGLVRLVGRLVGRLTRGPAWASLGDLSGLEEATVALYRAPRRLWTSGGWHLLSWLAGIVETWAALHVLHLTVVDAGPSSGWRAAAIIESLGQAVRALGFLIPGALGVQEGGYLVICGMFGIAAPQALALSLLRRVRELALGLPGLATWQWLEWRGRRARSRGPRSGRQR